MLPSPSSAPLVREPGSVYPSRYRCNILYRYSLLVRTLFFVSVAPLYTEKERERERVLSLGRFSSISLSLSLFHSLSPPEVKSLEASRRGRERRLVTFPSRPLFLRYTHATEPASRTPATHTTHPAARAPGTHARR